VVVVVGVIVARRKAHAMTVSVAQTHNVGM